MPVRIAAKKKRPPPAKKRAEPSSVRQRRRSPVPPVPPASTAEPTPPPPGEDMSVALHRVFAFDDMPFTGDATTRSRKALLLKALVRTLGIITTAQAAAGVDRSVYSVWRKTDEVFAKAADSVSEAALDFVEGKLLQNIRDGDTTAILFYLRSKGRGRGYDDRQRVVELPTGDTFTPVDFVALADLQRELPESTLDKTLTLLAEVLPPLPVKEAKE